jgi:Rrf2 family protein
MELFSQIGQYALRTMAAFAQTQSDEPPLRAADIAMRTGVPPAYVSKVLRKLTEAGLLTSQKGHHGGFRLAKETSRIRLLDVLAAVDALPDQKKCVFGWGACKAAAPCPLHPAWSELSGCVFDWARTTTLAQVPHTPLKRPKR